MRNHPQFEVHTNTQVTELRGNGKLQEVLARDRESGQEYSWKPKGAFVFVGLDPNTGWLKGAIDLDKWGFIVTDDRFQTTMPGLFAAGDARAGSTKQLGTAVGEGIAALLMLRPYLQAHNHLEAGAASA